MASTIWRRQFLTAVGSLLLTAGVAEAAQARRMRLPKGRDVSVKGTVRPGSDRVEYVFRARAGQRISVRLTSNRVRYPGGETAGAVFFVLDSGDRHPPDFGDYFYGGPVSWEGTLPRAGTYRIRILVEDGPDDPPPAKLERLKQRVSYRLSVRFPKR